MKNINSKNLLFICFISAMGGYLFGYDWVVIGGAKIFMNHSSLSKIQQLYAVGQ